MDQISAENTAREIKAAMEAEGIVVSETKFLHRKYEGVMAIVIGWVPKALVLSVLAETFDANTELYFEVAGQFTQLKGIPSGAVKKLSGDNAHYVGPENKIDRDGNFRVQSRSLSTDKIGTGIKLFERFIESDLISNIFQGVNPIAGNIDQHLRTTEGMEMISRHSDSASDVGDLEVASSLVKLPAELFAPKRWEKIVADARIAEAS
jgi:hypothetical protein